MESDKKDGFWFSKHLEVTIGLLFLLVYAFHEIAIHLTLTEEMAGVGGIVKHLFSHDSMEDWERLISLEVFFVLPVAFLIKKKMFQLKEAHEKTAKLAKEKSNSEEKIKIFAYSVAHDMKSPVTSLGAFAKRLHDLHEKKEEIDPSMQLCYKQILKLSECIVRLADDITAYIKTREYPMDLEPVDLRKRIKMIQSEFAVQFQKRSIEFHLDEAMPEINADRIAIDRVFRNLFDNALKYGGDSLSKIVVEHDSNKTDHVIMFHDNGKGIDGNDRESIFQIFTRTESSKGSEGTGLGLAIVKETLERHGGKVKVESIRGKATTFFLYLPRNQ
jgi:light-regulated signal transduction histidine kinase (bacteriophytochrome)